MTRRVATRRAVLRRAWLAAQRRMERDGYVYLSAEEEAGELLERWGNASIAWTFGSDGARRELARVEDEEEVGRVAP